ncbi:MAG: histidinol-phosphate transaminase [Verrucomicrobiota bacterium]|nr:histidinol-phosphate transaminase [Verrucomicrobiota bacterium]
MKTLPAIAECAQAHIRSMSPYVPGLQPQEPGWIKLNTNENPYPPSPKVAEAILAEVDKLRLYPVPDARPLRKALAKFHGVDESNVIIGNGSDDTINMLMRVFCGATESAGWTLPSYSLYPTLIGIQNTTLLSVPFERNMELPIDAIAASGAQIFFLTSPNAPTGTAFSNESIAALLERYEGILVVDEAYADFAPENAVALLHKYPNLVITRTFSKSYSLAGLRVGYGLASAEIVSLMDRVRDSYNLDRLAQAGALAALLDQDYHRMTTAKILATRASTVAELRSRGWFVYDTHTNFVFTEPVNARGEKGPTVGKSLFDHLNKNKVLVRYFGSHPFTASFLRISIGNDAEMQALYAILDQWK